MIWYRGWPSMAWWTILGRKMSWSVPLIGFGGGSLARVHSRVIFLMTRSQLRSTLATAVTYELLNALAIGVPVLAWGDSLGEPRQPRNTSIAAKSDFTEVKPHQPPEIANMPCDHHHRAPWGAILSRVAAGVKLITKDPFPVGCGNRRQGGDVSPVGELCGC